jgi:acyl-CoA synthetase (AMP-forming)/AMP-acid ligase II
MRREPATGKHVQISLGEAITISAQNKPDAPSFVFPDGTAHTFAQTNARVNRLVSALRAEGIGRGDRLAVFSLDSHRFVEIVLAALKLGAVYVPLNYRLRRGEPVVAGDDDVIGLAFTSGTTGLPKGAVQSQRMMKAIVTEQIIEYRLRPDEVRYSAAPTYHITGICQLLMGVAYGTASVIVPQFSPRTTLDLMAADRVTAVFMVPTMISTVMGLPDVHDHAYDRLQLMYYGAAAMSPNLLRRAMDTFRCDFLNAFGAGTEAGLQAVLTPEDHRAALNLRPELLGSIGKPAYGVALRIVDDDLNEVPVGEVGEIATRSDMVMDGYLEMPEETERALRGGWFRAGDMGYLDRNGYLYLSGRKKDMIIRGGENIYPIEIESVLADHPAVAQSAVVGVPDEHWSEIVRAWVTLRPGAGVTASELAAHCSQRLATYKVPAQFRFLDALPVNASGKILKRELRNLD